MDSPANSPLGVAPTMYTSMLMLPTLKTCNCDKFCFNTLTLFWNRCTISRSSWSCQSSSWVAIANKSSTLATSTGAAGGWFVNCSNFAGVSSPCVCQLMTSKGASDSRSQEQAVWCLFELRGDRVSHGNWFYSSLPAISQPRQYLCTKLNKIPANLVMG